LIAEFRWDFADRSDRGARAIPRRMMHNLEGKELLKNALGLVNLRFRDAIAAVALNANDRPHKESACGSRLDVRSRRRAAVSRDLT
ncbi:hypothetical protein, partial [Pseudarthrobacter sp. NKDBFgelt]|uniref:hypothetical protein n=1 Tax=Pseudarthrobacter sp. NKDBFgelt TaxID=3384443 RepID=UPI0038D3C0B1